MNTHLHYMLGQYTLAQHDQIIALGKAVNFYSMPTWMRDLLEAMVDANLLSKAEFDKIDVSVSFKKRVAETSGNTTYLRLRVKSLVFA